MKQYRADTPPMPPSIKRLPVQQGYPIPYFVEKPPKAGDLYDFRITSRKKMKLAVKNRLCWVCGEKLGPYLAFPIGPMCAINRTISEPPSHRDCAEWTAKGCPFLSQSQMGRRDTDLPEAAVLGAGIQIMAQPSVTCIWITRSYQPFQAPNGQLFQLGAPDKVLWFRRGRPATRAEVLEAIETGIPRLTEIAELQGPFAIAALTKMKEIVLGLIPQE